MKCVESRLTSEAALQKQRRHSDSGGPAGSADMSAHRFQLPPIPPRDSKQPLFQLPSRRGTQPHTSSPQVSTGRHRHRHRRRRTIRPQFSFLHSPVNRVKHLSGTATDETCWRCPPQQSEWEPIRSEHGPGTPSRHPDWPTGKRCWKITMKKFKCATLA